MCVLLGVSLMGCAVGDEPVWAFQHAVVSVDADGSLHGYQMWELFADRWERKFDDRYFLCADVQELTGEPVSQPRCPGCEDGFLVNAVSTDTDCEARWLAQIHGATVEYELLIGEPLAADEISADVSGPLQGWYQRFGDGEALPQGHVWSESGAPDALPMLVEGERYELWSTSAWALNEQ